MTELDLITLWTKARWHIIVSQFAPTFLLTSLVALLSLGLDTAAVSVRIAAAGILLASGVLGALAQIAAANEGLAIIEDLRAVPVLSTLGKRIVASEAWIDIVRFGTPGVFVIVYIALLAALFLPFA
ncbi:hypothetical protein E3T26_05135 [Cryobacterium sp. TMT1-21]|uniref:Uncharacterized protein n=1 Tax=Cryobacterium shii TaxID=1259235 RepID=A0AAQ2C3W9_9MICO|nr:MULTISPECIES: hypothetical protein [Cryobacterium]TFC42295.1 hypothetical protein E3O49_14730 [Cryobacterium shii]TFC85967.1 hypothetical protein E3T24_07160 [Cryobacterium sp. TmT2-59]TFD13706.1 hypothetical protein E3T42_13665 [Cryobacterium sp. TMT4-10]TFD15929.1 hypothetical protein E3T26_05135 [Cryobacterium sp. TMT1-21]TFD19777.1 hypothetical protein E3T32_10235 [Cryobacterium sp. TMT2-23]